MMMMMRMRMRVLCRHIMSRLLLGVGGGDERLCRFGCADVYDDYDAASLPGWIINAARNFHN